jgi:glycosyltransferase involved in cell wall biosynthesis
MKRKDSRSEIHEPPIQKPKTDSPSIIIVEPFYGGSHRQLVDLITNHLLKDISYHVCTLPARKWHWRFMVSSVYFSKKIPSSPHIRLLFVTSMVNLAELLGLRSDLNQPQVKKILYFHENQLNYPVQLQGNSKESNRKVAAEDFQIGWAQILSCMVADEIYFNSDFNRTSFLNKVDSFIRKIPEQQLRTSNLSQQFETKSRVLYFPLTILPPSSRFTAAESSNRLTIVWNHRWEYDKNPNLFFETLFELVDKGAQFDLIVLGESFAESPEIFETAHARFEACSQVKIVHWGFAESRERYLELLRKSDVIVSTSNHEFYGVAVLEAVLSGCYPLCPNHLVYPEFFDSANLYNTQRQLFKKLKYFCGNPFPARKFYKEHQEYFQKFTWIKLEPKYKELFSLKSVP